MKTLHTRRAGFTLIELMMVTGVMGMILTLAIPNFLKARTDSQRRICIANLNKIESAKQTWGLENAHSTDEVPSQGDLIGSNGYLKDMPLCPSGGDYQFRSLDLNAICTTEGHTIE